MNDFAKIFNHPNHGQIVVIADEDSDGNPAIVYHVKPEGLGVCKVAVGFNGDDAWEKLDRAFAKVDEKSSIEIASRIFDQIAAMQPSTN